MNKKTKKSLLIASLLILAGAVIFTLTMTSINWNFKRLNTSKFKENGYLISDNFSNISINTNTANITFVPSNDEKCMIVCYEEEKQNHTVEVENNTLNINFDDNRKWYEKIDIMFDTPKITVHLPNSEYNSFILNASTGDIEIANHFKFKNLNIELSTGDIKLSSIESEKIELSVSTGDITLADIFSKNITSNGNTGDILLDNVILSEKISIEKTTGDIKFKNCDASELSLKTSTGDVLGTLLSEKQFKTKTSTGKVNVPKTVNGGICEITTTTGDIDLTVIQ